MIHRLLSTSIIAAALLAAPALSRAEEVWLSSLNLSSIEQDWGEAHANSSVEGRALSIGGKAFDHGIGTHANSTFHIELDGKATHFSAWVGVDGETGKKGSIVFHVEADNKEVWNSGVLHGGDSPKEVSLDLSGVKSLRLSVTAAGDVIDFDHADWADAKVEMTEGKPRIPTAADEPAYTLTPPAPPQPRINGARVFGVRPGSPFLFTVAATGDRPMTFSADGLPRGLSLDKETGRITGQLQEPGEYTVTLHARNKLGRATRPLKIVCGPQIGLTPALGWNSWNCFAGAVSADKIKAAADAMVSSGLINHGWTYVNIDDFWQVHRDSKDPTLQGPQRDAQGRILPNPRFPDMKGLADYVHGKGLRIGLYSSPGPWTCGGCVASFDHELLDAQQYADWGFDYLKYDWCSYSPELESHRSGTNFVSSGAKHWPNAPDRDGLMKPYGIMHEALARQSRDILFSLCQYGMGNVWEWGAQVGGNSWRTTGDIQDTWSSMSRNGFSQNGHETGAGPGHFNDPDMLVVGNVGWGPHLHPTRLTPNEQYTHISLWCLLTSPLLIGCDMTQLDPFTLNLLSNDEVLDVDQDPLARQATRVAKDGQHEVWAKDLEDGSKAVGLFNRGDEEQEVTVKWSDLGIAGGQTVRDLWRQKDLGKFTDEFTVSVPRHGVVLVKISPAS
jgi:alpha-galactosidase